LEEIMKKLTLFTLLVNVLMMFGAANATAADKVQLCHVPPGNPENVQILEVGAAAAQKHIERHGDYLLPAAEVCDYKDNTCNREVDEGFDGLGAGCSEGIGACKRDGAVVCSQDGLGTVCDAIAGEPGVEACTGGVDEDCDDFVDCGDSDCSLDPACKVPVCGDGFVDAGEMCDDGNSNDGDGCGGTCQYEPLGAACFGGDYDNVGQCQQYTVNAEHVCELDNKPAGTQCQGNGIDTCSDADTCDGSGVCQDNGPSAAPEICDNGIDDNCILGSDCADEVCASDPVCAVCGNGIVEGGEACDDGNTNDNDACGNDCTVRTLISCSDISPITSLTLIWSGPDGVDLTSEVGQAINDIHNGDIIVLYTPRKDIGNDVDIFLSGAVSGQSTFHISCSDNNMDGSEDCGTSQGDGKSNDSGRINDWLLGGMTGEQGAFSCQDI
jgi:cysteine-rich repeat protein